MRGDAESVDIPLKHISNLLRHVRHIHHFNITGGEPSLNVRAIRHILERVRAYGITVNDFYIVTNGSATSRSEEFIEACAALYEYQEEKEQDSGHMLEMSDDRFHDPAEHAATLAALSPYPFFGVRGQAERIFLFREGRSCVFIRTIFLFDAFSRSSGDIASVSRRDTGHVPVGVGRPVQPVRQRCPDRP